MAGPEEDDLKAAEAGTPKGAQRKESEPFSNEPKQSQASEVVAQALQRFTLGVTGDGQPFAVPIDGPNIARQFRGGRRSLRAELSAIYRNEHGRVPSSAALGDALTALEGEAAALAPQNLHLRVAALRRKIVLDLGDETGRVVVVRPGRGWKVVRRSPVLFARTELTLPLPTPERDGDLASLRDILNVSDADWDLLVAFLVAALVPEISHPILLLTGEQGTAKTTTEKFLGRLIDPSPAETRQAPRDIEQWSIAAANSYVVPLDNLGTIQPWFSDALCRACTGEGMIRRRLYSDAGVSVVSFRRIVILNTIDVGALRGDLAERLVHVELERIGEDQRKLDAVLDQEFQTMRARLLGALLDLLAETLQALPLVDVKPLPRMADFARIVKAVDEVRGTDAFGTYVSAGQRIAAEVVEGDPVAHAVTDFMRDHDEWSGTAQELLGLLHAPENERNWPRDAQRLGGRLKRAAAALRASGISYEVVKATTSDRTRRVVLAKTALDGEKGRNLLSAQSKAATVPKRADHPDNEAQHISRARQRPGIVRVTCGLHRRRVANQTVGDECSVEGCDRSTRPLGRRP